MSRPTILIGIGTGGLRSIEASWKLSQEMPETITDAERPVIQYIYLETDESNEKPVSNEIMFSSLSMKDTKATINAIETNLACTSSWLQNQIFPDNCINGAGGSPVTGRLSLWDNNNRPKFQQNLTKALSKITGTSLEKPLIYVVGSLGGGTGSGTFLDIAYIIRDTLANQVELQGLFMIPNVMLGDRVIYSNTVCSIKELDYYNDEKHEFPFKWNANHPKGYEAENSPYDLTQIISAAYNDALAPVSYSHLQEEAGLFLYLNALGLYDTRRKALVDASGNIIISKYTTFGLSAIHYPESDLKYLLGNRLSKEMLSRIIDDTHYFDKGYSQKRSIQEFSTTVRNTVEQSFDSQFKKILEQWCNTVTIIDNSEQLDVDIHLENIAHMLASSNDPKSNDRRNQLYSLFRVGGEYYRQLKAHCDVNASDPMILLITNSVKDALSYSHNINIAKLTLNAIDDAIAKILNYWESNGYTKNPKDWDQLLKNLILDEVLPMPLTFTLLLEKEKVYYDRLKFILLNGLAMHVFSESLSKIKDGLSGAPNSNNNIVLVLSTKNDIMPSIGQLNKWYKIIENTIDSNDPSYKSCVQTEMSIIDKLTGTKGNIEYVYPRGEFEETIKDMEVDTRTTCSSELSIEDITNSDDLYTFLLSIKVNTDSKKVDAEIDLYKKVVDAYTSKINTGSFSVAQAVRDISNIEKVVNVAQKGTIPHLPINPTGRHAIFKNHDKIPHVLIGYDGNGVGILQSINDSIMANGVNDFNISDNDRDQFSHIGLNNWLIFYKEFGRMSDDKPFNLIDDLRDFANYSSEYYADSISNKKVSVEEYHGKRMPYINYTDCKNISTKYINDATSQIKDNEYENAERSYGYAMYWDMTNEVSRSGVADVKSIIQKESRNDKFDRLLGIANRYYTDQDYNSARDYYAKAENIISGDAYIHSQLDLINKVLTKVYTIVNDGDKFCLEANKMYDDCMFTRNVMMIPDCITKYNDILNLYNSALQLSQHDLDIKRKVSNIERHVNSLKNL